MAEFIIIASKVAKYLVAPIGRQLGYLFNYHSNLDDLKIQLNKLEDVKNEVKRDVIDSTRNGEEIKPVVEKWLRSVDGITEKAEEILLENEDKAKKRCLNGLCPNLKSRYQLSKKAKKTAKEVVKIQDGRKFERVSNRLAPQGTISSAPIKGYESFASRLSTLKEIMEALRNPNINMIGVYGMGGVGKTMLVKEAARKAMEDGLFDKKVMAVVSQPPNIRKLQEEIARPLGLKFEPQEIDSERVDRLCGRLKQEKSILIILDDIWAQLDLEAVGIPSGEIHKGCKIVVTSRRLLLLSNQMNIKNNFGIGQLLEEEAWNLFKKMAGDSVEAPEIKPTALKVAKECAGLPIAIAVVATALKNQSSSDWKTALHQLETAAPTTIEEMDERVYKSLRWSYDFLKSEEAQNLFLLCSLLPEDYQFSIQDLLYYGKGVGLFQGIEALEKARDIVQSLVNHLKASCLLLDGDTPGLFRMHDVVRDVAISVASKDKHMSIVRNSTELEEWMTEEQLKSCSAISLPYIDIHELPTGFESPALKFFLFFSKYRSSKIPDTFFEEMKQLKVLTLRKMYFSSLPSSLHFLSSLQTLCLEECELRGISIIGELKKLEILNLRGSYIYELPREIGQLTRLKLLDLRDCRALTVIPSNVIASLSQLEELYMGGYFDRWEADGSASLAELKQLTRLVTLEIYIRDANILPNDLVFEKLTRYRICIGDFPSYFRNGSDDYEISRTLKLKVNTSIDLLSGINKLLLKRTEDLHLEELNGFKSILNDSDGEGFHDTRRLHFGRSSEIEYVIDTSIPFSAFHNLESLSLEELINLKEICHGPLTAESFCNLRKVEVRECDRLQNLFPLSVARRLLKLQEIDIWDCKNMDGIVAEGREAAEDNNGVVFPQLRSLKLEYVRKLVSFCSKVKAVPCTSDAEDEIISTSEEILSISEDEHGISIPLFNEKDTFSNLENLDITDISMKEIWHSQLPDGSFSNLRKVSVHFGGGLQNLFPLSVARWLSKLQEIHIWCCENMDGIVAEGREAAEDNNGAVFPQLRSLKLWRLPKLVSFCSKVKEVPCTSDAGTSKEIISISEGEHGISIPLFNEKVAFPNLEELELRGLPRLMAVWMKDYQGSLNIQKLSSLHIGNCENLINVFATSMAQFQDMVEEINEKEAAVTNKIIFPQVKSLTLECLKQLKMYKCDNVEIFASELSTFKETRGKANLGTPTKQPLFLVDKVAFPNLEELHLDGLPRLMAVWMKDSQGSLNFQKLSSLHVGNCESLINVFTTSMAQFQDMVEEINEKEAAVTDKIIFPQVKSLTLDCLKQLKSFCQWIHISEWPSLKKLEMSECHNVKIFASELSTFKETHGKAKLGTPTKQPLFLVDKVAFPNLEEMKLNDMSSMEVIWQGQFHAQSSFCKLRVLTVKKCNKILKVFPISLLRNLENLSVEDCCSLEDVFELERGVGKTEHASTFPPLKELRLIGLPKLMHLWKEDSQLSAVFQNLKTLEVRSCGSLTHVFPSTRAESPVQIESTTDVSDKGKATDETTFSQLYSLKLKYLSNLTSFCPGSKKNFLPSLEKVLVEECPKLKTFSGNTLHTPKLEKVLVTEDKKPLEMNEWLWDGDLNTTIQHLFKQKMESIPFTMQGVWSNDPASQLEATTQFRKLLSIECGPSIDKVIKAGVIPLFVEFLGRQDLPQLQLEAVWALGNVAGDSPSFRDLVLGHGALMPLLAQLNIEHSTLSMLRRATWTLSNFCRGPFEQVKPALPVLRQLIHLNDEEVLTDACWALSYLSGRPNDESRPNDEIQAVIEAGVCPRLMELLRQPLPPKVLMPALRTVGSIATGDDTQTQFVIDNQVLPCLYQLLTQNLEKSITKEACWTISNITAGNRDQIQAVTEANIILPLVHLLQHAEFDIKKMAARAILNATFRGSHEQIQFFVSQGCIKPLCDLLVCPNPKYVTACLMGLEKILKVSEADKEMGLNGGINLYAQMIDECKGLDKLENLQTHDNNKISKKAVKLLRRYWAEKDDEVQNPQDG